MNKKTVIVTGASGGIGRAITDGLLARGYRVIGACRHPESLPDHPDIERLHLDLQSFESVRHAAASLQGIELWGIINNAGIMPVRETVITADGLERTYQVNYAATRLFTELLAPQVADGGVIVFTSSVARKCACGTDRAEERAAAARTPWQRFSAYGRTKLLLCHLTAQMARELAPRHIRVNAATPGVVDTGLLRLGWKGVDWLADRLFRPFISTPAEGASAALRAFASTDTGRLYCQRGPLRLPTP
ncbi:MAG: SDR family NAD(P)-dependent oxidoreductase, partial [Muribaculaceae bacterium]|nr:SDR family NAD(P)-dependent oxidoreductase [Muribaculaceae bacterium]